MIVPDVNVLIYAFRTEAEHHEHHKAWLDDLAAGSDDIGLVETVLLGFLRIVTNPRAFSTPAPTSVALEFVAALRSGPRARKLSPVDATWTRFAELVAADPQVRGNLIPDAWLAANALAHGGRVATADRGFARFAGLDFFDPVP